MSFASTIRPYFPFFSDNKVAYLDNAATTQIPGMVLDAMVNYYKKDHANVHRSAHKMAYVASSKMEAVREKVASYIGTPQEGTLIFTSGSTEASNNIAYGYGEKNIRVGDQILMSIMEHHSNWLPWLRITQKKGASFEVIPVNVAGQIDLNYLAQKLKKTKAKILICSYISNVLGTVQPIEKLIKLAHQYGTLVAVDGTQAMPHMEIDVKKIQCDFFFFSAHKMYGPTGLGCLYIAPGVEKMIEPYSLGGGMVNAVGMKNFSLASLPHRFEAGTPNIAAIIGMGATIDFLNQFKREGWKHELVLKNFLLSKIVAEPELIQLYPENPSYITTPIFAFNLRGYRCEDAVHYFNAKNIALRTGHHCAMPLCQSLSTSGILRLSAAFYSSKKEIKDFWEVCHMIQKRSTSLIL